MTLNEFVRLSPQQIRKSERLMQLFVEFYEAAFSFKPKCAGCSFKKGFKKLKAFSTSDPQKITKFESMETKTFKIKRKFMSKILTYKKDGVTHRKYGNKVTEDFARGLVESGQEDVFDILPEKQSKAKKKKIEAEEIVVVETTVKDYETMNYRNELLPLYETVSEKTGKQADSRKKPDIIAFLKANED
jgi:hypothetical protein